MVVSAFVVKSNAAAQKGCEIHGVRCMKQRAHVCPVSSTEFTFPCTRQRYNSFPQTLMFSKAFCILAPSASLLDLYRKCYLSSCAGSAAHCYRAKWAAFIFRFLFHRQRLFGQNLFSTKFPLKVASMFS